MVSALSITLNIPNIGLIIYYLVCVIILPVILVNYKMENILKMYLPLLLPIAVVLQEAGSPDMYQNILIKNREKMNAVSIMSHSIIALLTMTGILWFSNKTAVDNMSLGDGIMCGFILLITIMIFSMILLPYFIKKVDKFVEKHTDSNDSYKMHKYVVGFFFVVLICMVLLSVEKFYHVDAKDVLSKKIMV